MNKVIAKSDGKLQIRKEIYDDNGKVEHVLCSNIEPEKVLQYLWRDIILSNSFTLRDWFKLIINYPELQKLNEYFHSFIEEFNNSPKSGCIPNEFSILGLVKRVGVEKLKEKTEVEVYVSIDGLPNDDSGRKYGISFCKLSEILDAKIILDNAHVYLMEDDTIQMDMNPGTSYSLYDLIHSIIFELSFYGTPEERDKEGEKMSEILKKIQNDEYEEDPFL